MAVGSILPDPIWEFRAIYLDLFRLTAFRFEDESISAMLEKTLVHVTENENSSLVEVRASPNK